MQHRELLLYKQVQLTLQLWKSLKIEGKKK